MKCITCSAEIPPQWVGAINRNICPGCDGPICSQEQIELLTEMREAFKQMDNSPECIVAWLLSNYTLRKVGAAEPVNFHRKPAEVIQEKKLKIAKNPVQDFLKRKDASVAKTVEARKDFAEIVNQINSGEVEDPLYGNGEELESEIDIEGEEMDPYEEAEFNRQQFKSTAKQLARHSLVMPGGRPLDSEETAIMMQEVAGKTSSAIGAGENIPEALQQARLERLRKSRAIAGGGTMDFGSEKGTFRRH